MPTIPLIGGAYVARSVIANAQRCVNLFPEKNQEDAEVPVTQYQTPGLVRLASGATPTAWRGLYLATNLVLYGVLGETVYRINDDWSLTSLGVINSPGVNPVSMADNGEYIILVDGSTSGWTIELATDVLVQIIDPNFLGGDFVQYLDTFFVLNQPGTREFYQSDSNSITFPGLSAAKTGAADKLVGLIVNHLDTWLIGQRTTEIWSNVGSAGLPFQRIPGVFIQHGCVAKYSIAAYDLMIFWLSQDNNGEALALMGSNYQVTNIMTPAISYEISRYEDISDAIGFVYQQGNHVFYVLTFPTANKTWVYDLSTKMWHERTWTDQNGKENRIRANCTAFAYGRNVVGDYQNGRLYAWSEDAYTDDGVPIVRRRGFPHSVAGGNAIYHQRFMADIEVGTITAGKGNLTQPPWNFGPGAPARMPMISLRWSNTRGQSWEGGPMQMPLGATGEYQSVPSWRDLGQARDRVYELFWSEDCAVALNGAYLDAIPLNP